MSLYENMMEPCILMQEQRVSDGEGGWDKMWTEGAEFMAAIILDTSMQSKIAEANGVTSVYTITTRRNAPLEYHDVVKRLSDGAIFRVTSDGNDKKSPNVSTIDISQVSAEKWVLTR